MWKRREREKKSWERSGYRAWERAESKGWVMLGGWQEKGRGKDKEEKELKKNKGW